MAVITFSDLHTEAGLRFLESFLSGKTYISGFVFIVFYRSIREVNLSYVSWLIWIWFYVTGIKLQRMMWRFTLLFWKNPMQISIPLPASGTTALLRNLQQGLSDNHTFVIENFGLLQCLFLMWSALWSKRFFFSNMYDMIVI